ncbi:MAG: peptidylprolyl isomerase [Bacteroidales bacterium]
MRRYFFFLISGLVLGVITACNYTSSEGKENVIVEFGDYQLRRDDINQVLSRDLSSEDSLLLADLFVRKWVKEQLLFEKAKENIGNLQEIDREAEEYRRRLIVFEYEKQLVNERLATELSEQEMETFYQNHRADFVLQQPIVKGLFLKVPADAPQLQDLRKWMKKVDDTALEKIEKYSLQNALVYEYFFDRWESLDELMKNIPYEVTNGNRFLRENKSLEVTRNDFWYYLFIQDYLPAGHVQPYEYAREKIREVLLNQKKKGFIRSVEDELYHKALRDQKIKYYGTVPAAEPSKNIN